MTNLQKLLLLDVILTESLDIDLGPEANELRTKLSHKVALGVGFFYRVSGMTQEHRRGETVIAAQTLAEELTNPKI